MLNNYHSNKELERLRAIKLARSKRVKKSSNIVTSANSADILGGFKRTLNPYKASLSQIKSESKAKPIRKSNLTGEIMGRVEGYDYETGAFKK